MEKYEVVIRPRKSDLFLDFSEVWRYRELLYIFAWRDIKVRYKQTFLGVAWALFQPLVTMVIFTVFFGGLAKIPSGNLPYSLFVLCGLVFWTFFSGALTHAADSMVSNEGIIKKVYFPKIILPFSAIVTSSIDFAINFIILLIFAMILGFIPSLWILLILPAAVLITSITAVGVGLFLASFNVKYRDVRYILPFFIQILMFLSPVIYPTTLVSSQNRLLMAINPLTLVIESVRGLFSGNYLFDISTATISIISAFVMLIIGVWYFRKTEKLFADIV